MVVNTVLGELKQPQYVTQFVETYVRERKKLVEQSAKATTSLEKRIAQKDREIDRLAMAIARGEVDPAVVGRQINGLGGEREELMRQLEALPVTERPVALHPAAMKRYEEKLSTLLAELQKGLDSGQGDGASAMRELLEEVVVGRSEEGNLRIRITGKLNALVGAPGFGTASVVNDGSGGGI